VESPVTGSGDPANRHRVRVRRKLTRWEKIKKALEMPQLKRRERNQRIAIVGVVVALGVYFLVLRPIADWMFPDAPVKQSAPRSAPKGTNLRPR